MASHARDQRRGTPGAGGTRRFSAHALHGRRLVTGVPLLPSERQLLEALAERDETSLSDVLRRGLHLYAEHVPAAPLSADPQLEGSVMSDP